MLILCLIGAAAVVLVMLMLWALGIRQRNFSYVDLGWSANFAVLAVIDGVFGGGAPQRRWLICGMYAVWSLRLAWHLASRIVGQPEEGRYVQLRSEWSGGHAAPCMLNLKFLGFFQLQALLNVVLALPLLFAVSNPQPQLHWLEYLGVGIWLLGLWGETIADRQLKAFKQQSAHQGKVCDVGLWGWSRHPNYFFEWLIWIGYAVFAVVSPHGVWTLAVPFLMLHFLLNVTGVKATEAQALRSKGEAYRHYQRTVSRFIPLPRKQESR